MFFSLQFFLRGDSHTTEKEVSCILWNLSSYVLQYSIPHLHTQPGELNAELKAK